MKWWNSISFRLNLTLLGLTMGCLVGISISISTNLENFFIQDTQISLRRQAKGLTSQAVKEWNRSGNLSEWTRLTAQQGQMQVFIYDATGAMRAQALGVPDSTAVQLPQDLIPKTLEGMPQQGYLGYPSILNILGGSTVLNPSAKILLFRVAPVP
jgi:hypothetical protein